MNVLITGITGFRNRGVEAFVLPTIQQIHARDPNWNFVIPTPMPDYDRQRIDSTKVRFIKNDFYYPQKVTTNQKLRGIAANMIGRKRWYETLEVNKTIRSADLIIAMGGDIFSSDYGSLLNHLKPLRYGIVCEVPIIFLAHSIGPFKTADEIKAWKEVALRSSLITVRESATYDYLTEDLGVPESMVELTADPAFLLTKPSNTTIQKLLECYGISGERPLIGIAVSQGISSFSAVQEKDHFNAWIRIIQTIIRNTQAEILLIPHVQGTHISGDDRVLATKLLATNGTNNRLHLIGGDHSASEFKGIISACDMVIAERMHAAIAGLSSGVCTIVVGYSVKARGILSDLFGNEFTNDFLLIPVQKLVDDIKVPQEIITLWHKRVEIDNKLLAALPKTQRLAELNFDLLEKVLPK